MRIFKKTTLISLTGLALILTFRIGLQYALFQNGFWALTADEFSRTVLAVRWQQNPYWAMQGAWLPVHMYFFGLLFRIAPEYLYLPRIVTAIFGLTAIVWVYLYTQALFQSHKTAWIAAFLFSMAPAGIWLSSTPLTEMYYLTLIIGVLYHTVSYNLSRKPGYLYIASILMGLANGLRFEGWLFAGVFCIFVLWDEISQFKKSRRMNWSIAPALFIPWIFPFTWAIGSYLQYGNPFYFYNEIREYKVMNYGIRGSFLNYLSPVLQSDPVAGLLGIPAYIYALRNIKAKNRTIWFYLAIVLIPFVTFLVLHGGQIEPNANYIRYLAPLLLLFYPLIGFALVHVVGRIRAPIVSFGLLVVVCGLLAWVQIPLIYQVKNDPVVNGLRVGQQIASLRRAAASTDAEQPILLEMVYWEYLAVKVSANDIQNIYLDRVPDYLRKSTDSFLRSDFQGTMKCAAERKIHWFVLKSPELQEILEQELSIQAQDSLDGYRFYQITDSILQKYENSSCLISLQ